MELDLKILLNLLLLYLEFQPGKIGIRLCSILQGALVTIEFIILIAKLVVELVKLINNRI